jgi:hypothetical protein
VKELVSIFKTPTIKLLFANYMRLDAAGAVDAKTAPTAPWNTHKPRVPQRPQASL